MIPPESDRAPCPICHELPGIGCPACDGTGYALHSTVWAVEQARETERIALRRLTEESAGIRAMWKRDAEQARAALRLAVPLLKDGDSSAASGREWEEAEDAARAALGEDVKPRPRAAEETH